MVSQQIIEYIDKCKDCPEKIEKLAEFIEKFFMDAEADVKAAFIDELDEFVCGINKETLEHIMRKFKHRDGAIAGMKWGCDDIMTSVKQYDITAKIETYGFEYNPLHFWFTMNYVYATHFNQSRSIQGYLELAIDEYCNQNVCFKKYLRYLVQNFIEDAETDES